MRESRVENKLVNTVKCLGGVCWKWVSSRRGVPDRIVLLPVPEEHREIVNRYVKFVETKAPGGEPTHQQAYVHGLLAKIGYNVSVIDNPDKAAAIGVSPDRGNATKVGAILGKLGSEKKKSNGVRSLLVPPLKSDFV